MSTPLSDNTFTFTPPFDGRYLFDLYAGDYVMIWETFADVCNDYGSFVEKIDCSYEAKDAPGLKGAIHKIKPLFGFVGLLTLQAQCQEFERACEQGDWTVLTGLFTQLKDKMIQARGLIEAEKHRLEAFNDC